MGSEPRLRILQLLRAGELCVCKIAPSFEQDMSVISRHLATLERAGIIASRRDGRNVHYRITDGMVLRILEAACCMADTDSSPVARTRCCRNLRRQAGRQKGYTNG
jgi:DNA-binding transcriptional ArsR family regulator